MQVRAWYQGGVTSTHLNMPLGRVFDECLDGVTGAGDKERVLRQKLEEETVHVAVGV